MKDRQDEEGWRVSTSVSAQHSFIQLCRHFEESQHQLVQTIDIELDKGWKMDHRRLLPCSLILRLLLWTQLGCLIGPCSSLVTSMTHGEQNCLPPISFALFIDNLITILVKEDFFYHNCIKSSMEFNAQDIYGISRMIAMAMCATSCNECPFERTSSWEV